jgi:hypothetical protein
MRIARASVVLAALVVSEAHARKFATPGEQLNMFVWAGAASAGCRRSLHVRHLLIELNCTSCRSCPDTSLHMYTASQQQLASLKPLVL